MANLILQNNNKWAAAAVYDTQLEKSQSELNAEADSALQPADVDTATLGSLAALITQANNGKVLGIVNGALAAVEGGGGYPNGDEVRY